MKSHTHYGITNEPCVVCQEEVAGYIIDADELDVLRVLASKLQGSSDHDRDIGHIIWLVVNTTENMPVTTQQLNAIRLNY